MIANRFGRFGDGRGKRDTHNMQTRRNAALVHILIAEDQIWTRKGLIDMIDCEYLGINELYEAENGHQALDILDNRHVDILLTDIRMPGVDGLGLAKMCAEKYPHVATVFITGFDDFSYAQQALRYHVQDFLLKPVREAELNGCLDKIIESRLQRKINEDLLRGVSLRLCLEGVAPEEADPLENVLSGFAHGWKRLVLFRFIHQHNISCHDAKLAIESAFKKAGKADSLISTVTGEGIYFLVKDRERSGLRKCEQIFEEVLDAWNMRLQTPIRPGASMPFTDLNRLWIAGLECMVAWSNEKSTANIREIEPVPSDLHAEMERVFHHMQAGAELTNWQSMNRFLDRVFPGDLSLSDVKSRCLAVLKIITQAVKGPFATRHAYIVKTLQHMISHADHETSATEWMIRIRDALSSFGTMQPHQLSDSPEQIISWCKTYISSHLGNQISLTQMADMLHFTPGYLSQLFKQYTGSNYMDYVTNLKIAAAKRELEDTDKKVHDIARQFGYEDSRYFSKLFRRMVGMTPSEYRLQFSTDQLKWRPTR
jgi:two-component system response regulator YesN